MRGGRTLFTCLSEPLADAVRARIGAGSFEVLSFSELCADTCRRAGMASLAFSEETGPERLMEASLADPALRYDAIVVVEAQDFRSHWWIALESLLADPVTSRLHAFYDKNQSLNGSLAKELAGFAMTPIHLSRNLRNTKAIHGATARFYEGLPVRAEGPDGVCVEWLSCGEEEIGDKISDVVGRLIARAAVSGADVAVIAPSEATVTALRSLLKVAISRGVVVDTIARFKGLERRVVVLAATREIADQRELAYVGLSRARTHLVVAGEAVVLS